MRISESYPSKYLKAADLDGQDRTVTISSCVKELIGQGVDQEPKPVVYFNGGKKGLILNVTNARAIAEDYGDDTETWPGREIVLLVREVDFKGKLTPAIRVRVPAAAPQPTVQHAPAAPAPQPDAAPLNDEIPW